MTSDVKQNYRGVVCSCCRQPIPVPAIVVRRESSLNSDTEVEQSFGGAFTLRCRSCSKEMPYSLGNVVQFEGAPKPRVSRAQRANSENLKDLSRAANA
jgi:hypothetical protein